jgi:hypothetical protein
MYTYTSDSSEMIVVYVQISTNHSTIYMTQLCILYVHNSGVRTIITKHSRIHLIQLCYVHNSSVLIILQYLYLVCMYAYVK